MGDGAMGYADWANNNLLNSDFFGDSNTAVADGKTGIFIQTIAHEMLHVNEGFFSRLLSNSFRMGNPLGYFHRRLDDKAEEMVTRELIGEYKKNAR
jgi:hypothetical protein